MTPTHARKRGVKYRYYLSSALVQGQPEQAGAVRRLPATEIEAAVIGAVREHVKPAVATDDRSLIDAYVARVEVKPEHVLIQLTQPQDDVDGVRGGERTLYVPWRKVSSTRRREILLPAAMARQHVRPMRSETRATLLAAIARGRRWLHELMSDRAATAQSIAKREGCSLRRVTMLISLAFLAPDLVKAAIEGRLPRRIAVGRLVDMPPEWSRQYDIIGLYPACDQPPVSNVAP